MRIEPDTDVMLGEVARNTLCGEHSRKGRLTGFTADFWDKTQRLNAILIRRVSPSVIAVQAHPSLDYAAREILAAINPDLPIRQEDSDLWWIHIPGGK